MVPRLALIAPRLAKLVQAAEDVSVREIIRGPTTMILGLRTIMRGLTKFMPALTKFIPSIGDVLGSITVATVATLAATAAAATVLAVVLERTLHFMTDFRTDHGSEGTSEGTSDGTSDQTSDIETHSTFSIVARDARACSMPTPGCLLTGPFKTQANPSFCDMPHVRSVTPLARARLRHACRSHRMLTFSTEQHAIEGAIAFDNAD